MRAFSKAISALDVVGQERLINSIKVLLGHIWIPHVLFLKSRELLSDLIRRHIVFRLNRDAFINTGRDGIGVGRRVLDDRACALAKGEKTHGAALITSVEG